MGMGVGIGVSMGIPKNMDGVFVNAKIPSIEMDDDWG